MSISKGVHLVGFGFACVGCLLACWRARQITHHETRYGLYGLFLTSALWAGSYLVTFLTSSLTLATTAYQIGLICGLATVFAWLYFCSAYTGQTYHRHAVYRTGALVVFVGISVVKLTNHFHGFYFTMEMAEIPFPHASVTLLGLHWAVTVLAYVLAGIGFYMLLQLFSDSHVPTSGLTVLLVLMGAPAVVNALGMLAVPGLVAANYEPVGVAAFALGTLYVTEDTFERVRWTGHQQVIDDIDEAILLLDEDGRIYQYNAAAEALFPMVDVNAHVETVLGKLDRQGDENTAPEWVEDAELVSEEMEALTRYYLLRETELTIGPHQVGRAVVLSDVTTIERQRRELERQSDQLEGFAAAIAHELRNSLAIIEGNLTLVGESLDNGELQQTSDLVDRISDATDRMDSVIGDLTTIGRLSQPVTDPQPLDFQTVVAEAFGAADTDGLTLTIHGEGQIRADITRFIELIRNAVGLAVETDATEMSVRLTAGGFVVYTNGESVADSDTETLFAYGTAVPHADAGMFGPNIKSLAQAHGWDVTAQTPDGGGIAIKVSDAVIE